MFKELLLKQKTKDMDYFDAIKQDKIISLKLSEKELKTIFTPEKHLGASFSIITSVNKTVQRTTKKFI